MSDHPTGRAFPESEVVQIETGQQLRALGSPIRQRIIRVLRDRPATVAQIAVLLAITKGNAHYHVKVLTQAGIIEVVNTCRVRGVTEIYYGPVGMLIVAPAGEPGEPDWMMRTALAEVEAAPDRALTEMAMKILRLSPESYAAAAAMLHEVYDRIRELHDPEQPPADFFYALYRPRDYTRGEGGHPAAEEPPGP